MKIIYYLILLMGVIFMEAALADTSYKQPMFSLEFNVYGTGVEIKLNDIPVYIHEDQGQTSSQKPIPESIVDGVNVLTVKSFPLESNGYKYQKGAYIEATITVREKNEPLNSGEAILHLKLNPTNVKEKILDGTSSNVGGEPAIVLTHSDKQITVERSAGIKSPFPRWAWQDGQVIEDTPENFNSLLEKYKEIWKALNSGSVDEITRLYDMAAQEFAWGYGYKDKKNGHRIMNTAGFFGDDEWVLGDIEKVLAKRTYKIRIYGNGLMAKILDTQYRKSPIAYLNPTNGLVSFQKFGFYKNKAGEWIMIR